MNGSKRLTRNVKFFRSRSTFRAWLEKNHDSVQELWVGFHKKDSRKPSITYPEALEEALCFGGGSTASAGA